MAKPPSETFSAGTLTRRRLFQSAASLAAVAAAESLMPTNLRRVLAARRPGSKASLGSMREIKHVVLLMQENRSFDHYFGTLSGVRGYSDPRALKLPNGNSVFYQPDPANPRGYLLPFHADTRTSSAQKFPGTDHGWPALHECWNGGKLDQWVLTQRKHAGKDGPYCMGHYTREDIPFQFALAEAFTICDAYHCSVLGPTYPNRMYWMTGTIDPEGHDGGPMIDNYPMGLDYVPHTKNGYTWTTYAERLESAGISWKVYRGVDDYGMDMLKYFRPFREARKGSSLYTRAAMEPGAGPEGEFEYDATHDKLPTVSWIIPDKVQSEHPDHLPAAGASFVASKIDAIAANPDVWEKTLFILNFDENDGLFDHVAPPVSPSGTPLEFVDGLPIGAGFRVPCILVSPWTAGGWVSSEPFDHTSVLRFLERFTGVREPNISDWRRRTFGDLTSPLRFQNPEAKPPALPNTTGRLNRAIYEAAHLPPPPIPGEVQNFPKQEKGSRKRS